MRKGEYKRRTREDKFDRDFACWKINEPKAWRLVKRGNRRKYRRIKANELQKEIEEYESEDHDL